MPEKISRDISLIKYRNFPLWEFDHKADEEFLYYPKIISHYWLKLDDDSDKVLMEKLPNELTNLYEYLDIYELIFFGAYNTKWISKYTSQRDDVEILAEAVNYFKENQLSGKFNGAIKVFRTELAEFFKHVFVLTRYDGGFYHNHFLDKNQELLGYIHYSGEVCFDTLSEEMNNRFLTAIQKTDFLDAFREDTNRI